MFIVFHTLLILTHFLYDLIIAVHNYCMSLHRKCIEIWYGENTRTEVEWLVRAASKTKKLPRHVLIIFGAKEDTVLDCVKIIGWCITLGIPYVSFFDINGFLVKNQSFLKHEMAKRRPDLLDHISWSDKKSHTQNGVTGSKLMTKVSFLSSWDSREEIVTLTRNLAEAVHTGVIKSEEIDADLLDEKLHSQGIPDPDLALIYGQICSTYGVLPWQTRVTEFFMFPTYGSLSCRDFTYTLEKYNKCEQRYGK